MSTAIAVFCKTPGLSPTKTRLGVEIGTALAEEFYRGCIAAIEEVLLTVQQSHGSEVKIYWALAEKEVYDFPLWSKFPRIWTGMGGLGDRINHVFQELIKLHDQVFIMGSDSPQITNGYLKKAIEGLAKGSYDGIVGPCSDGGFVLFGTKKAISKEIWTEVKYSRTDTLEQLLVKLDYENYRYKLLPALGDVDEYDDLIRILNDFRHMGSNLLPKQRHLFEWIQSLLISKAFLHEMSKPMVNG